MHCARCRFSRARSRSSAASAFAYLTRSARLRAASDCPNPTVGEGPLGVKLPFATSLSGIYEGCLSAGLGGEDFCATIKPLEKQAALEVKGANPSA